MADESTERGAKSLYSQVSRHARSGHGTAETTKTATVETIDNDVMSLLLSGMIGL